MTTSEFTPDEATRELILRFLEGSASAQDILTLRSWLEQSEANRQYFDEVNTTFQATVTLNRFNHHKVDNAWTALSQRIAAENQDTPVKASRTAWLSPLVGIAASVCLLAVSAFLIFQQWPQQQNIKAHGSIVRNSNGTNTRILLPDGSIVWLNTNSTLEYPAQFGEASREVILKGEGFFDVRKGSKPFIVHAEQLSVQVKGTRFNVEAYSDSPIISTTLEEGKVELLVPDQEEVYVMKPGDQIVVNKSYDRITRNQVNPANFSAWKEDRLVFDNVPLDEIISKLENRYRVDILIESMGARRERMSMTIERETLDEVLDMIRLSSRLRVKKEKSRVVLFE